MAESKRAHRAAGPQGARIANAQRALLAWYRENRRDLPWRGTRDPYAIWVSEIMLQQTRVATVVPYYQRFLAALPTVSALAEAPLERVLELWSGLGYYRRARMLHRGARDVAADFAGALPRDPGRLQSIAGIGRYTAGAIASIAFGVPAPIVDGNVARVLSRFDGREDDPASPGGKRALWSRAEALARCEAPGDLNQALMELGATVCTSRAPGCGACPLARACRARASGAAERLPRVAPKAAPRRVALRAVVVEHRGAVVLGRRREETLYGGLWEPPMLGADDDVLARLGALGPLARRGRLVHVLSHKRLEVDVVHARPRRAPRWRAFGDYERFEAVPRDALEARGLSTLARRALAAALGADLFGTRGAPRARK